MTVIQKKESIVRFEFCGNSTVGHLVDRVVNIRGNSGGSFF